jgi:hypothetical protein
MLGGLKPAATWARFFFCGEEAYNVIFTFEQKV